MKSTVILKEEEKRALTKIVWSEIHHGVKTLGLKTAAELKRKAEKDGLNHWTLLFDLHTRLAKED